MDCCRGPRPVSSVTEALDADATERGLHEEIWRVVLRPRGWQGW